MTHYVIEVALCVATFLLAWKLDNLCYRLSRVERLGLFVDEAEDEQSEQGGYTEW